MAEGSGYPRATAADQRAFESSKAQIQTLLTNHVALELVLTGLVIDQLLLVQPDAYLGPGLGPSLLSVRLTAIGALLLGALLPRLSGTRYRLAEERSTSCASARWLLAESWWVAASPFFYFFAFAHGPWLGVVSWLVPVVGMSITGRRLRCSYQDQLKTALILGAVPRLLRVGRLGVSMLGFALGTVLFHRIGLLRSGLLLGGALASAIPLRAWMQQRLCLRRRTSELLARHACMGTLILCCLGALGAERAAPLFEQWGKPHQVVYATRSPLSRCLVTSGQGSFHVFLDDQLRFSTIDATRLSEAMVRPALARLTAPKSVLVLGLGEGRLEREVLADQRVNRVVSVTRDRLEAKLARNIDFYRKLTDDSLGSRRLTLVESDPAVWLREAKPERFDLIVVDLPDPSGPREVKYYSAYFYRRMVEHLQPGGIAVVQATSPLRAPRTFSTIGATLAEAGLSIVPLRVGLVAQGEWGAFFASRGELPKVVHPEILRGSYAEKANHELGELPADARPPPGFLAGPSELFEPRALKWYLEESQDTHG